jgi:fatty-acyl-CoA synthase
MKVICFGDSLTSCGGPNGRYSDILQDRFPGHAILNRGVGGETFVEALERLDADVLAESPDVVLVEFGANDWWKDERPFTDWARDLETVVQRLQAAGVSVVIVGVFGLYRNHRGERTPKVYGIDERAIAFRELERGIAEKYACPYIANMQEAIIEDRCCWRDRNHPNEHGNRFVADSIEPVLEKILQVKARPVRKRKMRTIWDMWEEAVELAGDRPAVADGDRRLTYAEADAKIAALAAGLAESAGSVRPRVAVFLPNCLEYYLTYWAVARLGGIIVPLNTWLKRDSLAAIFTRVKPDLLVVQGKGDREALACAGEHSGMPLFSVDGSVGASFAALSAAENRMPGEPIAAGDPAIIMHTSGTTSAPKGAVMRHADLIFNVMTTINAQGFTENDVHLLVNPMFHCTALYSSLPTAAYQKTPVVITADTSPDGLLRLIEKERITTCLTVPSILQRVTALPELACFDTGSLRVIGYAGSFMPVKTVRELQKHFPEVGLHNFFGLTETISATHVLHGDDALERPDSIGRLLPFVRAMIVDESGNEVPPGRVGELLFARENIIEGYWNQPGKLEESLTRINNESWFGTGDLAMRDEEGFFFIKGRKKDMIIVGGENVFASEVEAALLAHEGIREAAVKGVEATGIRESLGELIKAYIVAAEPGLNEREVRRHCHAVLPSYKIPHIIRFMDALPRNPSGKVVKRMLD